MSVSSQYMSSVGVKIANGWAGSLNYSLSRIYYLDRTPIPAPSNLLDEMAQEV